MGLEIRGAANTRCRETGYRVGVAHCLWNLKMLKFMLFAVCLCVVSLLCSRVLPSL